MTTDAALRLSHLFEGSREAYGTYESEEKSAAKNGKLEIKKTARTIRGEVTVELWRRHISGERPLGIIPIRENDTCYWGVVDVDRYDVSHSEIVELVTQYEIPMVVCKSKSGGAHIFLFTSEPVAASDMKEKLAEIATVLGFGDCEIFPKQTTLLREKGDTGNWLNMPYYRGDKTDRFGVKPNGTGMTMSEFLDLAESKRLKAADFHSLSPSKPFDTTLEHGPPCLQHLAGTKFPEGSRNNGLFNLGIFCKRKFGQKWKEILEKYNRDYMNPPLSSDEVQAVIKALEKKDYNYKCKDQPIVSHCNAALCRTRKFGVSGSDEYPVISGISVLETDPPIWFVDIEGQRVELETAELQDYRRFHRMCMDRLYICYGILKQETWLRMVGEAMRNAIKIEAPREAGTRGAFFEILNDFLTDRHRAEHKEEVFVGKPWEDEERGRYYFRLRDLMRHLEREKFDDYGRNQVANILREIGGRENWNQANMHGLSVYYVRKEAMDPKNPESPLPTAPREVI